MSYIGATPSQQLVTPAIDYFSGNGVTTTFTLTRAVTSVFSVEVVVNGVQQNPRTAYSINQAGNLVFDGAPSAGTNNIYVMYNSQVGQFVTPSPGTVQPSSISAGGPTWDANGNVVVNGNLGLGMLNPTYKIHSASGNNTIVNTTGTQFRAIQFSASDTPVSNTDFLEITNTRTATGPSWTTRGWRLQQKVDATWMAWMQFNANGNTGGVSFGSGTNSTTDPTAIPERMRINSSGHMITPFQPSFQAFRGVSAANQATFTGDSDILQFGQTFHNVGGHYNTSTFRFTAPVAGRYLFFCTARYDGLPGGSYSRLTFFINGSSNSFTYGHMISGNNHSTDYESSCISAVINLAVGDFVDVRGGRNGGGGALQFESQFSGILIG